MSFIRNQAVTGLPDPSYRMRVAEGSKIVVAWGRWAERRLGSLNLEVLQVLFRFLILFNLFKQLRCSGLSCSKLGLIRIPHRGP